MELTQDKVKELFEYRDGALFWKHRTISRGRKLKKGGQKVTTVAPDGYLRVGFNSRQYLVHRVIFLYHHGFLPECLDHINGIRSDNRIENLRPATSYENICNSKFRSDNTSGVKGVHWNCVKKKWQVRLHVEKKVKSLGYYDDLELAELVIMEARDKYHKEFANHGH
jgi:hypothetical protein